VADTGKAIQSLLLFQRGIQQHLPYPDETLPRQVDRRLLTAANRGRSDSERDSRARTVREAAGFCRLSFESGPLREQRHRSTAAGRPLLVSALRKALRAGRTGAYSWHGVALGAQPVFRALHQ